MKEECLRGVCGLRAEKNAIKSSKLTTNFSDAFFGSARRQEREWKALVINLIIGLKGVAVSLSFHSLTHLRVAFKKP